MLRIYFKSIKMKFDLLKAGIPRFLSNSSFPLLFLFLSHSDMKVLRRTSSTSTSATR